MNRFKKATLSLLLVLLTIVLFLFLNPFPLPPSVSILKNSQSLKIYAKDHKLLWQTRAPTLEGYRSFVGLEQVSPKFLDLLIQTEDSRFHFHPGVDALALVRALWLRVKTGRFVSGGSTISMQLIRLSRPGLPRNFKVKFEEVLLALWLEMSLSKSDILELYVNHLPFGQELYGVEEAANQYYHKSAKDLSYLEAATLLTYIRAPSRLDYRSNEKKVLAIRNRILKKAGLPVSQNKDVPVVHYQKTREYYFPHVVNRLLKNKSPKSADIHTTLDFELQTISHEILVSHLKELKEQNVTQGAVLIANHQTGEVLVYIGSKNYLQASSLGQIDGISQLRQPGSALKPFLYALALEQGVAPDTKLQDSPKTFRTSHGFYAPQNYNRNFHGPVYFRQALASSLNVPALNLHEQVGVPVFYNQLKSLGFDELKHPAEYYGLGLALGNFEVSLWQLVQAYTVFANLGLERSLVLTKNQNSSTQSILSPESAYMIRDMLSDDMARSLGFGEEGVLAFDYPVMVKTGTSQNYRDNWTVAVTPKYVVGVWVGNFNGRPMKNVSGVTGAAPVMREIVEHLYNQNPWSSWLNELDLPKKELCTTNSCKTAFWEFDAGSIQSNQFVKAKQNSLKILNPIAGRRYRVDPYIPIENQKIPVETTADYAILKVIHNNKVLQPTQSGYFLELIPGKNHLMIESKLQDQPQSLIYSVE